MKIEKDHVVRFHYTVSEAGGDVIESSRDREPVAALIGRRNIIPGLDDAMLGHAPGDVFSVTVDPEQAYGARQDNLRQRVPKKFFRDPRHLKAGMSTVVQTRQGPRMVTVEKVGMSVVDIDLNHPMAGKRLTFDIEVVEVRAAEEAEKAHGHVHGAGGHAHD